MMALTLFAMGMIVIVIAYWFKNLYVAAGGTLFQAFLAFPIREVRKLRRDNVILQTFPALIQSLPPRDAAIEVIKLLNHILRDR